MINPRKTHARGGFAMIEVVLATATVGVMTVAALSLAGSAARERSVASSRAQAGVLAQSMLDEIMAKPIEATTTTTTSGLLSGLSGLLSGGRDSGGSGGSGTSGSVGTAGAGVSVTIDPSDGRASFDEVTDYDDWVSTPPRDSDGTPIPGAEGLTRSVTITEVTAATPSGTEVADTGVYRIEVTIARGTVTLFTLTAIRTEAYDEVAQ